MSYGSEFQAVGPVTENARSPSLDLVGGTLHVTYSFHECCSRCTFQPYDCIIIGFVEQIQSTFKFC